MKTGRGLMVIRLQALRYGQMVALFGSPSACKQWGNMSNPVTFPIAFPTKALNVVTILQTNGDGGNMSKNRLYIQTLTTTGFSIQSPQGSYRYYALGC